ncbi:PQQ enzyme repeat family protein [Brugia malayi]|uniref:non-specific serine/threonine protein kinase n=1 Tax=Brugia malayi TaxID=6279 RepID=A0A0I9N643_BRUMA|nr:PQQ enzyme repeat family protein [Brugia malayi]CTP81514.1 BMA-IRE-1, isoform b [Brugia malayi]VIO94647.1 PQQ enzyme repeat family protein [Brugia malayi]
MYIIKRDMHNLFALFLILIASESVAKVKDIVQSHSSTIVGGTLLVSTIDGYLKGIDFHSGEVKWSLKEDPVLISPKTIRHGFTFIPDPQDGGLYILKDGQLKKLPYSIPQLVAASPCRTMDGVLYAGSKKDVWLEIDSTKGIKLGELSQSQTNSQCPLNKNTSILIGRSEYKLTMVDPENRDRRWNATYTDYSNHLLPADPSYPFQHFTSTVGGRLLAVNAAEGSVAWELDVGNTVVAMYILQNDGLHRLPYTVIGKETLEEFVKTLYVGENTYGLFALPAFIDSRTITVVPKYLGPPLLEGPLPVVVENEDPQTQINPSTHRVALINLDIAKITHKTVDGEFLVLGYHEPPQLTQSQLIPQRIIRHQRYPSLSFVTTDMQTEEIPAQTAKSDEYALWRNNHLVIVIVISFTTLFAIACWFFMEKLRNYEQENSPEQRTNYAQTSKNFGNFLYARQLQRLPHGWLQTGNIMYNPEDRLGHGCEGTVVFRGKFDGREVAVKRVIADIRLADREVDLLRESDAHRNVIRYFCMESDSNFRYIALELCDYSLFDYVERKEIREQCPLIPLEILHQATEGLAYLHSINIVHRDMKPQNVLLSRGTRQDSVRALISDFGLCKRLQAGRNSLSRKSGLIGTDGWVAPEALISDASITCAVDVFSLGCIYYYVLTNGSHPFGDELKRQANIMQGEYSLKLLNMTGNLMAVALIESMLRRDPLLRPVSATLAIHPFFWNKERQLRFFMDVSDRIEKLSEHSFLLRRIEENARSAIGFNWRQAICPVLAVDLRKFRTYKGNKVRDLLRAMRNKKHHYQELPTEVQQSLGQVPDQFVTYFTDRFPQLLQHTYDAMICCANEHAFSRYYSEEARKKADEFVAEMAASEIKESELDRQEVEFENKKRESISRLDDKETETVDEENPDGKITTDISLQEVEIVTAEDPTAIVDNRRNRKRRKRPKHY